MTSGPGGRRQPDPRCPLRPSDPCTLCQLDVTGPHDCGLVYLMMADEDLRDLRRARLASAHPVR